MTARIVSAEKQVLPVYDTEKQADHPTLVVLVKVEFLKEDRSVHHTQTYHQKPGDLDVSYFKRQADAMQADIDHSTKQNAVDRSAEVADEKIAQLLGAK